MRVFTDMDFDTIQMLFGFILIAAALVTAFFPSVPVVAGMVCLLLLKDGIPNFVNGFVQLAMQGRKQKAEEQK